MASTVELILKTTATGVNAFGQAAAQIDKLKSSAASAGTGIKGAFADAGAGVGSLVNKVGGLEAVALGAFGAIAAGSVAMRRAFDLGEQGAAIAQTAESFDRLNATVFQTPGLLDAMSNAARGTISEFDLMRGSLTLVAGVSGDVAAELGRNAPALIEIAKAANKLNPSLGDTAFLYESLNVGIKRNSPLILDNLGIVGAAEVGYAKYAAQLGKTVEELTASEKQIGLMYGVIEKGNIIIEQAGGNVDAMGDSYAQTRTSISEFTDAFMRSVDQIVFGSDALSNAAGSLGNFADTLNDSLDKRDVADQVSGHLDALAAEGMHWSDRMAIAEAAVGSFNLVWREGWVESERIMGRYTKAAEIMADGFKGTDVELMKIVDAWEKRQGINERDAQNLINKYKELYPEIANVTEGIEEETNHTKELIEQRRQLRNITTPEEMRDYAQSIRDGLAAEAAAIAQAEAQAQRIEDINQRKADSFQAYIDKLEEFEQRGADGGAFFYEQAASDTPIFGPDMVANGTALNDLIVSIGQNAGITALQAAALGIASGTMSADFAEAHIKAAILNDAIKILFDDFKATGSLDAAGLLEDIDNLILELQNKELPELALEFTVQPVTFGDEMASGERRWYEQMGEDVEIPVTPVKSSTWETALGEALGAITGTPEADRTVEILAGTQAILDATTATIPDAITAIPVEARTVTFIPNSTQTDAVIDTLSTLTLQVTVDFVAGAMPQMPGQTSNTGGTGTGGNSIVGSEFSYAANGGPVYAGMPYIVGEAGREMFIPSTNGTIVPHVGVSDGRGGGNIGTFEISQYFYGPASPDQVRSATERAGSEFLSEFKRKGMVA